MERVKFERRKDGEVAILPRADYERLAELARKGGRLSSRAMAEAQEDAGTQRIMQRSRKALRQGRELLIPAEFSDRMARGESPLRVMRTMRGLSQAALAAKAKISQPVLSQFERGFRTPSLATYKRLAHALAVPLPTLTGD
jgi:ribosome-binding protein aMBF1 (putative translation factor)